MSSNRCTCVCLDDVDVRLKARKIFYELGEDKNHLRLLFQLERGNTTRFSFIEALAPAVAESDTVRAVILEDGFLQYPAKSLRRIVNGSKPRIELTVHKNLNHVQGLPIFLSAFCLPVEVSRF